MSYFSNPVLHWLLLILVSLGFRGLWRQLFIFFAVIYMIAIGWSPLPGFLLSRLESKFEKTPLDTSVQAVVILGGGSVHYQRSIDDYLAGSSFARVLAGLRLAKTLQVPRVIFTGGTSEAMAGMFVSEADSFRKLALEFGLRPENILIESRSTTTYENAKLTAVLLDHEKIDSFYLVTSAYHMNRAMDCFRRFGKEPIAHPTDNLVYLRPQVWNQTDAWVNLRNFALWTHEVMGSVYYDAKY